jgi:hypothetical protein
VFVASVSLDEWLEAPEFGFRLAALAFGAALLAGRGSPRSALARSRKRPQNLQPVQTKLCQNCRLLHRNRHPWGRQGWRARQKRDRQKDLNATLPPHDPASITSAPGKYFPIAKQPWRRALKMNGSARQGPFLHCEARERVSSWYAFLCFCVSGPGIGAKSFFLLARRLTFECGAISASLRRSRG